MVVTTDRHGRARFEGIPNRVLREMTPDQLVDELERVKRDQDKLKSTLTGMPRYAQFIRENVKERNCLASERRRIERELERRYRQEIQATPGPSPDAC